MIIGMKRILEEIRILSSKDFHPVRCYKLSNGVNPERRILFT